VDNVDDPLVRAATIENRRLSCGELPCATDPTGGVSTDPVDYAFNNWPTP
jgi:hypothetical protein